MKLYIQKDLNDPSKLKLESRSHPDSNTVCPAPEGEEIEWLDIVDGEFGGKSAVVNEERKAQVLAAREYNDREAKWDSVRAERDKRITDTDWTQLSDAPINEIFRAKMKVYRQKLRDVPAANTDPYRIAWPTKPKG